MKEKFIIGSQITTLLAVVLMMGYIVVGSSMTYAGSLYKEMNSQKSIMDKK